MFINANHMISRSHKPIDFPTLRGLSEFVRLHKVAGLKYNKVRTPPTHLKFIHSRLNQHTHIKLNHPNITNNKNNSLIILSAALKLIVLKYKKEQFSSLQLQTKSCHFSSVFILANKQKKNIMILQGKRIPEGDKVMK